MTNEPRSRAGGSRRPLGRAARWVVSSLWPNQRLRWTREGIIYIFVWVGLLLAGLYQQVNLILLVAGLAAGPVVASIFVSASMLRRISVSRRIPAYIFSGEVLRLEYAMQNDRRWTAALALNIQDELVPVDRSIAGATSLHPRVFFPRVPGKGRARIRWEGQSPRRGRYEFRSLEVATRSPFGLFERRVSIVDRDELVVYPTIGHLTRRWHLLQREASETRRGQRHDRSVQQQEYHGLRDYRPGDSPRWIHWRTSARLGQPMVKEFEQQHEQDLAVLIDPWLPRTKVTSEQREYVEEAIRFAATLCYETCRHSGRRLLLGWTGAAPGVRQGPSSVKLLHDFLEQLARMRPATEGGLAPLLDAMPPAALREAVLVVVSTRPLNLLEEAERSARLSGTSSRGIFGRVTLLDASRGDLTDLIQFGDASHAHAPRYRALVESGAISGEKPSSASLPPDALPAGAPTAVATAAARKHSRNGSEGLG